MASQRRYRRVRIWSWWVRLQYENTLGLLRRIFSEFQFSETEICEEHLNKVPVRQISPMEGKKIKIMLPGETVLVKGHIVALTRNIRAVCKVREGRMATSRSKKGKNDIAIIRGLEDDEEAGIGGEVGSFVPKQMGEGGREGGGKVVKDAKQEERRGRIRSPKGQ